MRETRSNHLARAHQTSRYPSPHVHFFPAHPINGKRHDELVHLPQLRGPSVVSHMVSPSPVGWRPSLLGVEAIATRVEAIATRMEAIATRVEAIATMVEAMYWNELHSK